MQNAKPANPDNGLRLFSYVTDRMEHDRLLTMVITVLITLGAVASILVGIAVWPVVLSYDRPNSVLTALFSSAKTAGIVMLSLSLVISIVVMLIRRSEQHISPMILICLLIDIVIAFVFTIMHIEVLDKLNMHNTMGCIIWFFASLLFSYALSIIPALLVSGLVKLLHMTLNTILPE